jgi:hypothetical protein
MLKYNQALGDTAFYVLFCVLLSEADKLTFWLFPVILFPVLMKGG